MELNYSRQDLELLVSEAERLVRARGAVNTCGDQGRSGDQHDGSSDSDYETRASREWLVRAEPNISLRPAVTSTPASRRRPRRSGAQRRPDWRLSLPECLEYYQPPESEEDGGRMSQASEASLPLSDLWEHELMADGEEENDIEKALPVQANLTDFGEDYSQYLYSETETDSDNFSDESEDVNNLEIQQSSFLSRHGVQSHRTLKSQTELKLLLIKTNPTHDSWKCEKELVSI